MVELGKQIVGSGRTGVMAPYPKIVENVKETLHGFRDAGAVVNLQIAHAVLVSEVMTQQPRLLINLKSRFKAAEAYGRDFLGSIMDWLSCKSTRQTRHIP